MSKTRVGRLKLHFSMPPLTGPPRCGIWRRLSAVDCHSLILSTSFSFHPHSCRRNSDWIMMSSFFKACPWRTPKSCGRFPGVGFDSAVGRVSAVGFDAGGGPAGARLPCEHAAGNYSRNTGPSDASSAGGDPASELENIDLKVTTGPSTFLRAVSCR